MMAPHSWRHLLSKALVLVALLCSATQVVAVRKTLCGDLSRRWLMAAAADDMALTFSGTENAAEELLMEKKQVPLGAELFAILDKDHCAENLPYGDTSLLPKDGPFFTTMFADTPTSQMIQLIRPNG